MPVADISWPVLSPAQGWDSDVFLLQAENRAALRTQVHALAQQVEGQPTVPLVERAHAWATSITPGGSRLAVVATTPEDLWKKLHRAAERLHDRQIRQIRDANGIYYYDQPLGNQGTVALLFPGEGAQYLNMLADLCPVFPEVEETFAWCDQLAADAGWPAEASLRRVLHVPPQASADAVAAAEAQLRGLGPSIFGVLLADLAIFRILAGLQVPVAAMAGHSAGELGALLASGAMHAGNEHGFSLPEILDIMQRQENEAGGPDVTLLAVGASKATIEDVAREVARGEVIVAMDNCPHQCVAVGPTPWVAAVEAVLTERGIVWERLPFRRPYHTPLFEPYMGAFRTLFAKIPFYVPHTPVYCCSTGTKFPPDPEAIRQLAVNHWVMPVEFTRLIETMYADGVRLFVECGPRGNLSAFVEDILRGRSFAAIPANVLRKSGPTQINHMVAQLFAHGVDLNWAYLYQNRLGGPRRTSHPASRSRSSIAPTLAQTIVDGYFDLMEQFLDTQRDVMTAFLGGAANGSSGCAHGSSTAYPLQPPAAQVPEPSAAVAAPAGAQSPSANYCLIGDIVAYTPGQQIVFRRRMDEQEDRYVDDHTLGGRGVSRVDPTQNGLPVLPMTFSLEAMSEAASLLLPGKVVIAIRQVRLYRWLPFDAEPTTLEVQAQLAACDPQTGIAEVKANVRDLGNSFLPDGAHKPASEAVIVLADRYPEPPPLKPFRLTDEVRCRSTVEDLRRNMFHGPLFQMITSLDRTGREGIEGTLEVKPRHTWFRSNPDPRIAIDPVLTDAAMHILGAWHLEQPDWTGRILLPIGLQLLEFFGPPPPPGTRFIVRGHNEHEDARQVRHGVEVFDSTGRLWMRLTSATYWRFYLPFGDVNFFGPKDQYFLSTRVVEAEPSRDDATCARCYYLDPPLDLQQPVLRASGVRVTMTPREIADFTTGQRTDAEQSEWFFRRLVAKDAVRAAWNARHGGGIFPADMESEVVGGRIVCRPRDPAIQDAFPPVAVAVVKGQVAAVAAFADRVGIALVLLDKNSTASAERQAREIAACAALADAYGGPVEDCQVQTLDATTGVAVVTYQGHPYRVQTARHKDAIIATTLGERLTCTGANQS
ncbi:MAG: polyketide synthase dehydratase domain-containing protein [Gemmataceae bacterium]|nr:polyketide synthase dehydratase domain-containing protein [Gemmata sp.]MDW8197112.1 polyketide synthase dehydratase domain-containing protein [Gemmataceae bacterium]